MKNVIHEIHRRSLWQVLAIYLGSSWLILSAVDTLAGALGLPEWSASFALFLLIIGLPIVLGTAFVQEGLTTKEAEAPRQSLADVGEVDPPPTRALSGHHKLFTWRNALVGGAAAFALLGVLTAGYLFLRAAGIGPAGTLVAQGVLEEGAPVVLADFEGSDAELAELVTGALRIDLLQSPTIEVVERGQLTEALARMQLDEGTPLTSEIARELAQREGYGAVIEGEVRAAGSGYLLSAGIVGGEDWTTLAAFRETANGDDEVIEAIEGLSRAIRDKAGESLRTVRGAPGLARVSTSSLEALRLYTRAERLDNEGDRPGALELFERAVETDPDFAMAHRKIGVILGNMFVRRADEVRAIRRAYELRDRLPESERYLAEAFYHGQVVGDREAAARAYETLLEVDPDNVSALNNLANQYLNLGRIPEAERLYDRALSVERFANGYSNLILVRELEGRFEDAARTVDRAVAEIPEATFVFENLRVELALTAADYERADSLAGAYARRFDQPPLARSNATAQRYRLSALRGRLRDAERHIDDLAGVPAFLGNALIHEAWRAGLRQQRGEAADAARQLGAAVDRLRDSAAPGDPGLFMAIAFLLDFGDVDVAGALYEAWLRETPDEELGGGGRDNRQLMAARVAGARGETEEALRLFDRFERRCPGTCGVQAAWARARVLDAAGDQAGAAREYERWLETPDSYRSYADAQWRAQILERLGHLYDELDDPDKAATYYAMFVEQWSDPDPELRPRVEAAQARLQEILGERG